MRGIELQPWDSDLMGFPVGRISPMALAEATCSQLREHCVSIGLKLAYVVVPWEDSSARRKALELGAHLADQKLHFFKNLDTTLGQIPEGIALFQPSVPSLELESLALASGEFSRFRTDSRMGPSVFHDLYLTWIRRSVRGEIADAVLVLHKAETMAGMVTVGLREDHAEIGLLAVAEGFRGRGMGGLLIDGAEAWSTSHGVHALTVDTQGANTAACALYAGKGYEVKRAQAVYHLWMEPRSELLT